MRRGCGRKSRSNGIAVWPSRGCAANWILTPRRLFHRASGRRRFAAIGDRPMPTKRRVPKDRAPKITPEAIALFRRGLELQAMGADDVFDDSDELSDEREEYNAIWRRL